MIEPREILERKISKLRSIHPKTVVIFGNGAVVGGSEALERAIEIHRDKSVGRRFGTRKAFLEGMQWDKYLSSVAAFNKVGNDILFGVFDREDHSDERYEQAAMLLRFVNELRRIIGATFVENFRQGKLSMRAYPDEILRAIDEGECIGITSNWDQASSGAKGFQSVFHLHGQAGNPNSLLFPTEFSSDFWFSNKMFAHFDSNKVDERYLKLMAEVADLRSHETQLIHDAAVDWLREAKKVIFWGISLSAYDSEMLNIVSMGFVNELIDSNKEVICINSMSKDPGAYVTVDALCGVRNFKKVDVDKESKNS